MPEHRLTTINDSGRVTVLHLPHDALGTMLAALDDAACDLDYRLDGPEEDYTAEDRAEMSARLTAYDRLATVLHEHRRAS